MYEAPYAVEAVIHTRSLMKVGIKSELGFFTDVEKARAYAREKGIPRIDLVSDQVKTIG